MSYYVTLPSTGSDLTSEYGKKNNTQSDFEIDLKNPLVLPYRRYEMGLSEISYRKNWVANLGEFIIKYNEDIIFEKKFYVMDGLPLKMIITQLNDFLNDFDHHIDTKSNIGTIEVQNIKIYFNEKESYLDVRVPTYLTLYMKGFFSSLLVHSRNDLVQTDEKSIDSEPISKVKLEELKQSYRSDNKFVREDDIVQFKGDLYIATRFDILNDKIKVIENFYVYTNIIDETHVGSQMSRLLRIVPVRSNIDENISEIFDIPHYMSLDSSYIDRIRMLICDEQGDQIRFINDSSSVIYKLHFKPKSNF